MNIKSLSIALALTLAAGASFASDIDLSAALAPADVDTFGLATIANGVGAAMDVTANTAVISQDATADVVVAFINQEGTTTSVATISQTGGNSVIAHINQNGTINAVAMISQK